MEPSPPSSQRSSAERELALEPLLREYERLKYEQTVRIGFRDNLLYFTLGYTGAAAVFAHKSGQHAAWFSVPLVATILGWTYLANDTKVSGIGRYVAGDLSRRVSVSSGTSTPFGWEDSPLKSPERKARKPFQLLVDLLAFVVPSIAAPIAFVLQETTAWWAFALAAVAWLFAIRLASVIVFESDVTEWKHLGPLFTEWRLRKPAKPDRAKPFLTVDLVIVAKSPAPSVLLVRRGKEPFKDSWALPGGYVERDEPTRDAAIREAREETGLAVDSARFVGVFDSPGRDPRGWTVSIAYAVEIENQDSVAGADDAAEAAWHPADQLPELAFDHGKILAAALVEASAD